MIKQVTDGRSDTPSGAPDDASSVGGEVADAIGRRLRSLYDGISAEPVPDKFRQLIEDLERKSNETK